MNKKPTGRIITTPPSGACYKSCRKAIEMAIHNGKIGIIKTSIYVYKATIVSNKRNTAIVERCYREYYKENFKNKWQLIGAIPVNPKLDFDIT